MPNDAPKVTAECEANWEANKADCNAFLRAVSNGLGRPIPAGLDANGIVEHLRGNAAYSKIGKDGSVAKTHADSGKFVIGGLKGVNHNPSRVHGHVVVVVAGPLAHSKYPTAYWGSLGGVGAKAKTLNYAWKASDRDVVEYFSTDLP